MAKQNRDTLRRYFQEGALPTADHFSDLIDSSLNLVDQGFEKSAKNGLEISLVGDHKKLISFFENSADENPNWSINFNKETNSLSIENIDLNEQGKPPTLNFSPQGNVGIGTRTPSHSLEVKGVVASLGRIGGNPTAQKTIPADGKWHSITGTLNGCNAFEIVAGVGDRGTGNYALVKAEAINAFNPSGFFGNFLFRKKRIKTHQSWYLSSANKIKFRWHGKDRNYCLQMRTAGSYGKEVKVRFYLTQLWFDELMYESWQHNNDTSNNG